MKQGLFRVALFSITGLLIGACAPALKETRPGEISDPYFRPKRVYTLDFDQAWDLALKGLNLEGISLRSSSKDTGLIQTDYANVSPMERNRCALRFSPEPYGKTFIHILCRREARADADEPFRDTTYSSPLEAMKAEEILYRKIEPYLLPAERPPRLQQEMIAKGGVSPISIPAVPAVVFNKDLTAVPSPGMNGGRAAFRTGPAAATAESFPPITQAALEPAAIPPSPKTHGDEKKPNAYVSTVEAANARKAPSTLGPLFTVLRKGEKAERVGASGIWSKVRLDSGDVVWVHSDFLKEVDAAEAVPGIISAGIAKNHESPRPAKGNPAAGAAAASKMDLETRAVTRMRAEPSPHSKVVLVLRKGRAVEKIEDSGPYSKVRLSWGDTGWVLKSSLKSR